LFSIPSEYIKRLQLQKDVLKISKPTTTILKPVFNLSPTFFLNNNKKLVQESQGKKRYFMFSISHQALFNDKKSL
jgi:hypothetical protein